MKGGEGEGREIEPTFIRKTGKIGPVRTIPRKRKRKRKAIRRRNGQKLASEGEKEEGWKEIRRIGSQNFAPQRVKGPTQGRDKEPRTLQQKKRRRNKGRKRRRTKNLATKGGRDEEPKTLQQKEERRKEKP